MPVRNDPNTIILFFNSNNINRFIPLWKISRIYLSTEDEELFNIIHKEYGEMVVAYDDKVGDVEKTLKRLHNAYDIRKYIITKGLLAKCDYFIGGINGASIAVMGLNGGNFKDKYIFDLGKY